MLIVDQNRFDPRRAEFNPEHHVFCVHCLLLFYVDWDVFVFLLYNRIYPSCK